MTCPVLLLPASTLACPHCLERGPREYGFHDPLTVSLPGCCRRAWPPHAAVPVICVRLRLPVVAGGGGFPGARAVCGRRRPPCSLWASTASVLSLPRAPVSFVGVDRLRVVLWASTASVLSLPRRPRSLCASTASASFEGFGGFRLSLPCAPLAPPRGCACGSRWPCLCGRRLSAHQAW